MGKWFFLTFIVIIALAIAVAEIVRRRRMGKYWSRHCTGNAWKDRFPQAPASEIRDFLQDFVDGFAYSSKKRLKFDPDDRLLDIYKSEYPNKGMPDALEFETIHQIVEEKYGIDLQPHWSEELTLGQVFQIIMEKKSQRLHLTGDP